MSKKSLRIMVDANAWIDSYCSWHASCDSARAFFNAVGECDVLLYPVHVAKDVLFVIGQEFKRATVQETGTPLTESQVQAANAAALACMRNMCERATAVGADGSDIWLADKYLATHHDFEDNLVLAACRRAKVDYLVTADKVLIEHADVCAKTPRQMTEILKNRA